MDIDANITGTPFSKNTIENILYSIIQINIDDNVTFEINKIKEIKESKDYNGFRFSLIAYFSNLRVPFHIDISTGDVITPRAINYQYKKIFDDEYIDLIAYNYETIIAEKFQIILELKLRNSRMKDYYDLYYFSIFKWKVLDISNLKKAIRTTFRNRNTLNDLDNAEELLREFKKDETLNKLWKEYQKNHSYAENITFTDAIKAIEKIVLVLKETERETREYQNSAV